MPATSTFTDAAREYVKREKGAARAFLETNPPRTVGGVVASVTALVTLLVWRGLEVWFPEDPVMMAAVGAVLIGVVTVAGERAGAWAQRFTWPDETVSNYLLDAERELPMTLAAYDNDELEAELRERGIRDPEF